MPKVNIHTPAGLDSFIDHLADGAPVILADMGAGSGQVTYEWFERMYPDVADAGIGFTTIGVVTADPASVESVLAWAARLQNRVSYLIVENSITDHADFTYWHDSEQARQFRGIFQPAVIRMDYRLPELENAARNHGVTLGMIASRATECFGVAESLDRDARPELPAPDLRRIRQGQGAAAAMTTTPEPDLIDRIGAALPKEVRADYYREVAHCRSLPENDEMLRILRVMLILTLLMETVPNRMVRSGKAGFALPFLPAPTAGNAGFGPQISCRCSTRG